MGTRCSMKSHLNEIEISEVALSYCKDGFTFSGFNRHSDNYDFQISSKIYEIQLLITLLNFTIK